MLLFLNKVCLRVIRKWHLFDGFLLHIVWNRGGMIGGTEIRTFPLRDLFIRVERSLGRLAKQCGFPIEKRLELRREVA